jgi:hypothetical protein
MKDLLLILLLIISTSCQSNTKKGIEKASTPLVEQKNKRSFDSTKTDNTKLEGAIGIITTSDKYQFGDTITIFNKQKQAVKYVVITEEYHPVFLKCLSEATDYYQVKTDDGKIGYISKKARGIKFQTWEQHILASVFSVSFKVGGNPLKEAPNDQASEIVYDPDEFYHPSKIEGDWLQVKWGSEGNWRYGWIKWKNEDKLLIELSYFA